MKTPSNNKKRPVIYQLLPRLFTNYCSNPVPNGPIHVNGSGKLNSINDKILESIKGLGVTHVWYTGVIEHSHDVDYTAHGIKRDNPQVIKGHAGSPYAITDYYDIDPDLAEDVDNRMAEFEQLVERTHSHGLKVIIDFVPNHVAREYRSDAAPAGIEDLGHGDNTDMFFSPTNNFYYIPRQQFSPNFSFNTSEDNKYIEFPAKASGNDSFTAFPNKDDWYDTVKLNYGYDPGNGTKHFDPIPPTWFKMLNILRFWASKNIDGFRCDMVHMVPLEFWAWAIPQVKAKYKNLLFIAEIYDPGLYRPFIFEGKFDYLYDKVSLYDTLRGIQCSNWSAAALTSCWQTVDGISQNMLTFLENHDEQRYASRQFAGATKSVTPLLVATATMNTGAVMIYAGQELGEDAHDAEGYSGLDGRTTIFDYWSVEKIRRWLNNGDANGALTQDETELRREYAHILGLVNKVPAIREGRFFDLMYVNYENPDFNPHRQFAYLRSHEGQTAVIALNFDSKDVNLKINIPIHAFQTLDIQPRESVKAHDLLSGAHTEISFSDNRPMELSVKANSAAIILLDDNSSEKNDKKARSKHQHTPKKS